jgi:hypothetical protein
MWNRSPGSTGRRCGFRWAGIAELTFYELPEAIGSTSKLGGATSALSTNLGTHPMQKSRLIVGLILIIAAALLFVFGKGSYSTAGVIALLVLGLASIAISRRK